MDDADNGPVGEYYECEACLGYIDPEGPGPDDAWDSEDIWLEYYEG